MEPHVVAGTSPRAGVDTVFGSSDDADEQLTPVETYLLEALERLDAAESRALQLETALAHSRDIGAAIGILMALRRVTREQAFDQLRRASMERNVKLHVLALEVVETGRIDRS
ncbi:ANTAR domain-containing protein [Terracoccus sp. 273MFTsu3.1]|uniref:ANTAR domain-containing protein n=1 Tax=Terracoccus sp. 273MFTsu3.1 TaxID=1172188 RepID=UPI0003689032|nr:ANTAR domain-containing protein [Terracoccus sp. 273MFTsu3.1]